MIIPLILLLSGCVGPVPSGEQLKGIPEGATVISSSNRTRTFKFEGCFITQQYQYEGWTTTSISCD